MNQFVYMGGLYREFRGYVFANMRPVTITDRATLEAVEKDKSFRRVEDEKVKETPAPQARPILTLKRGPGRPRK